MKKRIRFILLFAAGAAICQVIFVAKAVAQSGYAQEQTEWRKEQEKDLTTPNGWLTLAGLYWFKEGRNTIGGAAGNDFVFPGDSTPPSIGVIEFHAGVARFTAADKVNVTTGNQPVSTLELKSDDTGHPTVLHLGTLSWNVIKRGERYGVRLRDSASDRLTKFTGMKWYPAQPDLRVIADFTAYEKPRTVAITNVLGDVYQMQAPGLLTFKLNGAEFTLEPVLEDDHLFIIFRDLTSNKTTYPAGRFLYAAAAKDGKVILDFNQAVNPPCAFTPFATCPLPPARNWLKVAIPAGELKYH